MHNATLHGVLETFTADATCALAAETARGVEIPFELTEERGRRTSLYCYRPLTGTFIQDRLGLLSDLPSYGPAARAVAGLEEIDAYLRERGEQRVPREARERADSVLRCFLGDVFSERSEFELEPGRFEAAYARLERAVYEGRSLTTVIVPLLGIAFEHATEELALEEELFLIRGDCLPDAPADAVWGEGEEPNVLAVLTATQKESRTSPVSSARARFRRVLTALRLFERGGYALGPLAWTRTDTGPWAPVPFGGSGRPRFVSFISAAERNELRDFYDLVEGRAHCGGEFAWALARFEMGCERLGPFEALTDYLLALRALLEPEGPGSGRLAGRLAALCANPEDRASLAERTAHAISLERAVIVGLAPAEPGVDALVDELAEHLRALLRDILCGHLDPDLRAVADQLLAEAAGAVAMA